MSLIDEVAGPSNRPNRQTNERHQAPTLSSVAGTRSEKSSNPPFADTPVGVKSISVVEDETPRRGGSPASDHEKSRRGGTVESKSTAFRRRGRGKGKPQVRQPSEQPRGAKAQALVATALSHEASKVRGDLDALKEKRLDVEDVHITTEVIPKEPVLRETHHVDETIAWYGIKAGKTWNPVDVHYRDRSGRQWFWYTSTTLVANMINAFLNDKVVGSIYTPERWLRLPNLTPYLVDILHPSIRRTYLFVASCFNNVTNPSTIRKYLFYLRVAFLLLSAYRMWLLIYRYTYPIVYKHIYRLNSLHTETDFEGNDKRPMCLRTNDPLFESQIADVEYRVEVDPNYACPTLHYRNFTLTIPWFSPNGMNVHLYSSHFQIDTEILSHAVSIRTAHPSLTADTALLAEKIQRAVSSLTAVNSNRIDSVYGPNVPSNTVLYAVARVLSNFDTVRASQGFSLAGSLDA